MLQNIEKKRKGGNFNRELEIIKIINGTLQK